MCVIALFALNACKNILLLAQLKKLINTFVLFVISNAHAIVVQ